MREIIFDGQDLDKVLPDENLIDGTSFAEVYECFLGKITDDMYLELTPQDTLRDLQRLLLNAIPAFEFPKVAIDSYYVRMEEKQESLITESDFVIGPEDGGFVLVESSHFEEVLTNEEINKLEQMVFTGRNISLQHTLEAFLFCCYTGRNSSIKEQVVMRFLLVLSLTFEELMNSLANTIKDIDA